MEVFSLQIDFCIRINVKGNISDVKSGKKGKNISSKKLLCWTYFRSDFRQVYMPRLQKRTKLSEDTVNLFLELHALKLTKLDGFGIKWKEIKVKIWY